MMSVDDCIEGEFFSEFLGNGNAKGVSGFAITREEADQSRDRWSR
jgi:hypothetical protein